MTVYDHICATVARLKDSQPYEIDGQVVREPNWYNAQFEHYWSTGENSPVATAPSIMGENERTVVWALIFLLALAIIMRR